MTQPNPLAGEEAAGIAEYFEGDCACENARKCKSCDLKEMITEKLLSFSHQQAAPLVEALNYIQDKVLGEGGIPKPISYDVSTLLSKRIDNALSTLPSTFLEIQKAKDAKK